MQFFGTRATDSKIEYIKVKSGNEELEVEMENCYVTLNGVNSSYKYLTVIHGKDVYVNYMPIKGYEEYADACLNFFREHNFIYEDEEPQMFNVICGDEKIQKMFQQAIINVQGIHIIKIDETGKNNIDFYNYLIEKPYWLKMELVRSRARYKHSLIF